MPQAARVGPLGHCTSLTCTELFCCGLSSGHLCEPFIIFFQVLDFTVTPLLQTDRKEGPTNSPQVKEGLLEGEVVLKATLHRLVIVLYKEVLCEIV